MNTRDEQARFVPPEQCLRCRHIERWQTDNVWRVHCLRGEPMHPECGWFKPTNMPIDGVRK